MRPSHRAAFHLFQRCLNFFDREGNGLAANGIGGLLSFTSDSGVH